MESDEQRTLAKQGSPTIYALLAPVSSRQARNSPVGFAHPAVIRELLRSSNPHLALDMLSFFHLDVLLVVLCHWSSLPS
jgi:hypothetical protein